MPKASRLTPVSGASAFRVLRTRTAPGRPRLAHFNTMVLTLCQLFILLLPFITKRRGRAGIGLTADERHEQRVAVWRRPGYGRGQRLLAPGRRAAILDQELQLERVHVHQPQVHQPGCHNPACHRRRASLPRRAAWPGSGDQARPGSTRRRGLRCPSCCPARPRPCRWEARGRQPRSPFAAVF